MLAFGELFAAGVYDKGVVQVQGAPIGGNLKHGVACTDLGYDLRKGNLACRRIPDVLAPDNVRDALDEVVYADGELVGPVTVSVADGKVAALPFGIFAKITEALVVPVGYFIWNANPQTVWNVILDCSTSLHFARNDVKTFSLVNDFSGFADGVFGEELLTAAGTGVDKPFVGKSVEDLLEKIKVVALNALRVVFESEPFKVFVNAVDVFFAGAALVVVFDAQVNLEVPFLGGSPHVKGGE